MTVCPNCWGEFEPTLDNRSGCCCRSCAQRQRRGKLNAADVAEIRQRLARGEALTQVSYAFGVVRETIQRIARAGRAA